MNDPAQIHPTPWDYWLIALILAVITGAEVAVTYIDALDSVVAPLLIAMSAAKFTIVVGYFMHLKYEQRIYRNLFVLGLIAAPLLFGTVLLTFGVLVGD
jgi:cytochrome c oxidase subunit 4